MSDIEAVKKQLEAANMNVKGLVAQLEATKQMLNEQLQSSLQLRANVHLFQQSNQEQGNTIVDLKNQIETHKAQIVALSAKILELQPPVASEVLAPVNETDAA